MQVGDVQVFHAKALPCKWESSKFFAASLFLAGWSGLVSSLHVGESLPCMSLRRRSESSRFFISNVFIAGEAVLRVSRRVSSLQVGFV